MLSLVNYGSSDESDIDDETRPTNSKIEVPLKSVNEDDSPSADVDSDIDDSVVDDNPTSLNNGESTNSLPTVPSSISTVVDNNIGEVENDTDEKKIVSSLPTPTSAFASVNWEQLSKLRFQTGAIKILAPPLPKDEEPVKKEKRLPSSTGSSLLSLLPKPKNEDSSISLTPRSVQAKRNLPPKPRTLVPTTLKKKVPTKPSSDSEGEDGEGDFFSLSSINEPIPEDKSLRLAFPEPKAPSSTPAAVTNAGSSPAFIEPVDAQNPSQFIPVQEQELDLDEEAIKKLCGSRGLKRKADELRMIDIDGSQIIPDAQAILTKNLTEEMPRPARPKGLGVSSQQKRKHQITYLAQQAKEQELELQNTWANNRMSRKQTQAKYGF